jgi:hypothetical protein
VTIVLLVSARERSVRVAMCVRSVQCVCSKGQEMRVTEMKGLSNHDGSSHSGPSPKSLGLVFQNMSSNIRDELRYKGYVIVLLLYLLVG